MTWSPPSSRSGFPEGPRRRGRVFFLLPLPFFLGCAAGPKAPPPRGAETVLLIHGMGRSKSSLAGLGRRLAEAGYRPVAWAYPSLRGTVEDHGERLHAEFESLDRDPAVPRFHVVGHSLGAIVARHALTLRVPRKMGRFVMLSPPNQGSPFARWMGPALSWIAAPLPELSDSPDSFVRRLGVPGGVEIGVIAASFDEKVRRRDTHLEGEAAHLVVPGLHGFVFTPDALAAQVVAFLRDGRFRRSAPR